MLKDIINLANRLDKKGLTKEADVLDNFLKESTTDVTRSREPPSMPDDITKKVSIPVRGKADVMTLPPRGTLSIDITVSNGLAIEWAANKDAHKNVMDALIREGGPTFAEYAWSKAKRAIKGREPKLEDGVYTLKIVPS